MAKVLVVDDSLFMRKVISCFLDQLEHEVIAEASNGEEAVKIYEQIFPDFVIMDITMEQMNGIEALKRLKPSIQMLK